MKLIENSIQKHPAEYLWQHRRFKSSLGKHFYE
jgi:lauroyl/myristoyl acyltransferase